MPKRQTKKNTTAEDLEKLLQRTEKVSRLIIDDAGGEEAMKTKRIEIAKKKGEELLLLVRRIKEKTMDLTDQVSEQDAFKPSIDSLVRGFDNLIQTIEKSTAQLTQEIADHALDACEKKLNYLKLEKDILEEKTQLLTQELGKARLGQSVDVSCLLEKLEMDEVCWLSSRLQSPLPLDSNKPNLNSKVIKNVENEIWRNITSLELQWIDLNRSNPDQNDSLKLLKEAYSNWFLQARATILQKIIIKEKDIGEFSLLERYFGQADKLFSYDMRVKMMQELDSIMSFSKKLADQRQLPDDQKVAKYQQRLCDEARKLKVISARKEMTPPATFSWFSGVVAPNTSASPQTQQQASQKSSGEGSLPQSPRPGQS